MRLQKLILHGFKSFADKTEFVFDAPITGIVGPNGCGKSNVVDAFKWVLGEQSAKSLRGDAMLDVIFNGSGTRQPAGMAEVTLVFENPRGADGKRQLNLDMDEVSVGRQLFRDGTSEYKINNQNARLKDVRELFLDTGVGVDAYSVIEQGRVAALLDANPAERRLIFEEAADISKFRQRKKEAQRKLERVDQNLLRAGDIGEELEKRLRSVRSQASRAKTCQEYTARLSELRLAFALHEYHRFKTHLDELQSARDDAQFRLDDASGDLANSQNRFAEHRDRVGNLSDARQILEREVAQADAAAQSARQRQVYADQQIAQIAEQSAALAEDRTTLESKLESVGKALETERQNLQTLTQEVSSRRKLINDHQRAFGDCQLRLASLEQEREASKSAILDVLRQLAAVNSRLGALDIERKNASVQQSRLSDRRNIVAGELQRLEGLAAELQANLDDATATLVQQQREMESKRTEAAALDKQITQVGEQLGAAREHRCGLDSRRKLLEDLENRREGVSEGVQSVLRQRQDKFPFVRGLVADVLRVDIEHAHVIEAALDGRDQWLITADSAAAADSRGALDELEGRINLLCTDSLPPIARNDYDWKQCQHPVRLAVDLVRFDPADAAVANALLSRTVVVEQLPVAMELRSAMPGFRFVTHDGEVLEADGTLKAGPLSDAMGLLSRRSELDAIAQQIAEVDGRIQRLAKQLADDNSAAKSLEEQIGLVRNAVYATNMAKVQATGQLAQNSDLQSALRREQPLLDSELNSIEKAIGQLNAEQSMLAEKRRTLEEDQAARHRRVEELTSQHRDSADELRQLGEDLTAARVELGAAQEKQLASDQSVQRQTAAMTEIRQQVERVAKSAEALVSRRQGVQREKAAAAHEEETLAATLTEQQAKLQRVSTELTETSREMDDLAKQVDSIRSRRQDIEQDLHKLELSLSEENVRLQTLLTRTQEEMQLDVAARYAELGEYQPGDVDFDAMSTEIKELREKIARLGSVNLEAIGELAELEERQKFLAAQLADLITSKQQLIELIDEMNRESSARFEKTFNAVREHFQGMFRRLFGGGKADLYLETELAQPAADGQPAPQIDVLEAGIEIIARPPGKQPVTISQLSGGEKTMTCVALLLSIFKSKPSPFCILDEVDAALDEANNERFNTVVQEFLDQSQFIVITHSKRTMRIAEVLYGVTMQEQGVSKRVAVKFDQIDNHGRVAETAAA